MAEFNIPVEVPAERVDDLIAALRWRHGQVEEVDNSDPENPVTTMRDRTIAELRAILKQDVIENLQNCVVRHEKFLAAQAAAGGITPPDIT
jgi:hypothetical protein